MSFEHFQQLKARCLVLVGRTAPTKHSYWNLKLSLQLRESYTKSSRGFAQVSSRASFVCFWDDELSRFGLLRGHQCSPFSGQESMPKSGKSMEVLASIWSSLEAVACTDSAGWRREDLEHDLLTGWVPWSS